MTNYIAGVKIDIDSTYDSVLKKIEELLATNNCHYITTTNPEFIMAAQHDAEFKAIINASAMSTPDGSGILMAQHYLDSIKNLKRNLLFPLKAFVHGLKAGLQTPLNTVTGQDLVYKICALAEQKNYSVYLLGGGVHTKNNLAQEAADNLKLQFPKLNIIGATSQFSYVQSDDDKSTQFIKDGLAKHSLKNLDILFVAYGQVNQEKWIVRNNYKINAKVSIGVGSSFDVISSHKKRAPQQLRKIGMEWFYRLIQEPSRYRRIVTAAIIFPTYIYLKSLRQQ